MNLMSKMSTLLFCCLSTATALATPTKFITHNTTDVESNVFIGGKIPSPYPTEAHSTSSVGWNMVRIGCTKHTTNGKCKAIVKVATDTDTPIELGMMTMDLESGDVSPNSLSAQGYTLTVTGVAEVTLTKN